MRLIEPKEVDFEAVTKKREDSDSDRESKEGARSPAPSSCATLPVICSRRPGTSPQQSSWGRGPSCEAATSPTSSLSARLPQPLGLLSSSLPECKCQ